MLIPLTENELAQLIEDFELPELPEPEGEAGEAGTTRLVLFRFQGEKTELADGISLADAQEYCDREDTHGRDWFVGYYRNEE